jgi:hypothetical protein
MATEAILMLKHLEIIDELEDGRKPRKMLTLGDINDQKLKFREHFNPMQLMAIQFIQNATNPHLHYQRDSLPNREGILEKVLEEIDSILEIVSNDSKLGKGMLHGEWKSILRRELDTFEWTLKKTILNPNKIHSRLSTYRVQKARRKREKADDETNISNNEYQRILSGLDSSIRRWEPFEALDEDELLQLLKDSVEAGLIAMYHCVGAAREIEGKGKKQQINVRSKRAVGKFYEAVASNLGFDTTKGVSKFDWGWLMTVNNKGRFSMAPHWTFLRYY